MLDHIGLPSWDSADDCELTLGRSLLSAMTESTLSCGMSGSSGGGSMDIIGSGMISQ